MATDHEMYADTGFAAVLKAADEQARAVVAAGGHPRRNHPRAPVGGWAAVLAAAHEQSRTAPKPSTTVRR